MRTVAILLALVALTGGCKSKSEADLAAEALNRGLEAQVAGRTDEARKEFAQTLAHDPKNKFAYYNLGLMDQQGGQTASAVTNYRACLEIDPDYEPALFNLAIAVTPTDKGEAEKLYRHMLELNPAHAGAHLNLGFLLKEMGREEEGEQELSKAIELDPALQTRVPQTPNPSPEGT